MEILKYRNSLGPKLREVLNNHGDLDGIKRQELVDEFIRANGEKITAQEYFNHDDRNSHSYWDAAHQKFVDPEYSFYTFGEPKNCMERLIKEEIDGGDDDLSYIWLSEDNHEDLCESRTDWESLKGYTDGLYAFIKQVKREFEEGKLIYKE